LMARVALLAGQPETLLEEVYETGITLRPGAATVTATMRAHGAVTALVSGGFRFFTERIAAAAGFDEVNGNRFEISRGRLTGRIVGPIAGADEKRERLTALAAKHRIDLFDTLAAGDGANDVAMLRAAGLGVAFHAKPAVRTAAAACLDHAGLVGLLYVQGYRRDDFVAVDG
ncbi:MAG: HAD-IB family phosphatase, partial [Proteobacteria bacterium]|nr:HAD-IB family phosphatase [Pseudomonadota bacterium]